MNRSGRLVAVGLAICVVVTLSVPVSVLANVPDREQGGISCVTDASGHAQILWHAPMNGVAVFDGQFPAEVDTSDGLEIEHAAGGLWVRVFKDGFYSIHVTSTPSSPCTVGYAVDAIPANDHLGDAELLDGSSGEMEGTTRAAVIDDSEAEAHGRRPAHRLVPLEWPRQETRCSRSTRTTAAASRIRITA